MRPDETRLTLRLVYMASCQLRPFAAPSPIARARLLLSPIAPSHA